MGFSYQVMSETEAEKERYNLLKEGEYDAVIATSEDKVSASSGNPMMDMILHVYDEHGKEHPVRDFMVFTKSMMWKVINFANSAGLMAQYESGNLCSESAMGNRVRVKIGIESGSIIPFDKLNGKPAGSKYPDKNKVVEYLQRKEPTSSTTAPDALAELDDDVPF